jgi:acid stress-induced BolA-like protein IbaG/YrbA
MRRFREDWLAMSPAELQTLIEAHLPASSAQVSSADNVHFEAIVVSAAFAGRGRLQRHQMVYRVLGKLMSREIHALSMQTFTPEEFAQQSDRGP